MYTLEDAINDEELTNFIKEQTDFGDVRDYISYSMICRMYDKSRAITELQKIDGGVLDILERVLCDFESIKVVKGFGIFGDGDGWYIQDSAGVDLLCYVMYDRRSYIFTLIRMVCIRRGRYDEIRVRLSK